VSRTKIGRASIQYCEVCGSALPQHEVTCPTQTHFTTEPEQTIEQSRASSSADKAETAGELERDHARSVKWLDALRDQLSAERAKAARLVALLRKARRLLGNCPFLTKEIDAELSAYSAQAEGSGK
jgi:hypothetical protein